MGRKKKVQVKERVETVSNVWIDPNPDPYGFNKLIEYLRTKGYSARKEDGVVMVELPRSERDNFLQHSDKLNKLVFNIGYVGSWGVRVLYGTKKQQEVFKSED